jgi:hypothetical protein
MESKAEVVRAQAMPSMHPKNLDFPEIVTVTETNERVETTEERKLTYETGAPRGTSLIKKLAVIQTTIRTTTPYTGTVA